MEKRERCVQFLVGDEPVKRVLRPRLQKPMVAEPSTTSMPAKRLGRSQSVDARARRISTKEEKLTLAGKSSKGHRKSAKPSEATFERSTTPMPAKRLVRSQSVHARTQRLSTEKVNLTGKASKGHRKSAQQNEEPLITYLRGCGQSILTHSREPPLNNNRHGNILDQLVLANIRLTNNVKELNDKSEAKDQRYINTLERWYKSELEKENMKQELIAVKQMNDELETKFNKPCSSNECADLILLHDDAMENGSYPMPFAGNVSAIPMELSCTSGERVVVRSAEPQKDLDESDMLLGEGSLSKSLSTSAEEALLADSPVKNQLADQSQPVFQFTKLE